MMPATCIIPNCRRKAPDSEPFCAYHRDKPRPKIEEIQFPARSGIEAQHVYNDVFPGDLTTAKVETLAQEVARKAVKAFEDALRAQIAAAFAEGMDYLVSYVDLPRPDMMGFKIVSEFRGGAVEQGAMDGKWLPPGSYLFRLVDWRDRIKRRED